MVIHCPECDTSVDAKECGHVHKYEEDIPYYRSILLECPLCQCAIVAGQEQVAVTWNQYDWGPAVRLWPNAESHIAAELPEMVRVSLEEAHSCFRAKAYLGCAVMCGRVIEAICIDFNSLHTSTYIGLRELLDRQIIDKKIYEWGDALRIHRNIGAHASESKISKEDAKDLLDFALAICEYVYILTKKFQGFIERKQKDKLDE